jgi:hypothetical protein
MALEQVAYVRKSAHEPEYRPLVGLRSMSPAAPAACGAKTTLIRPYLRSVYVAPPQSGRATNWRPDLSIIAPGWWVARMPGTGTLRRSSPPARKKAIVGKSRVEATRLQRLSFVFLALENDSSTEPTRSIFIRTADILPQYPNTPILQYSNTPIPQYSNTPLLQYSNTPILQYPGARV